MCFILIWLQLIHVFWLQFMHLKISLPIWSFKHNVQFILFIALLLSLVLYSTFRFSASILLSTLFLFFFVSTFCSFMVCTFCNSCGCLSFTVSSRSIISLYSFVFTFVFALVFVILLLV